MRVDHEGKQAMKYSGKFILFVLFLIVFMGHSRGFCEEPGGPASTKGKSSSVVRETGSKENLGVRLSSFFRDIISPVDGDRCPSLPSCSSYSVNAFKKHGFFTGWLMTVDRLLHEADEGSVSPRVYHNGRFRVLDPVENNDYWWFCEDGYVHK